jgi:hypothetical protein
MRPNPNNFLDCFFRIPIPSTIEHSVLSYTPWQTARHCHLALTRAALTIRATQLTIIDAHNIPSEIFRQSADIPRPSHGDLIADKWTITVIVVSARHTIKPIHLIEALHLISIVQAMPTDQSRIALGIIHTLSTELALWLRTHEMTHAGEAGIGVGAWLSDEFFDVAPS